MAEEKERALARYFATDGIGFVTICQANANLNELAKRLKQAETLNVDLQRRVDELNSELQVAHNDAQRMQAELARLRVSVGELQERSDALGRENKQLSGEFVYLFAVCILIVAAFINASASCFFKRFKCLFME